MPDSSRSQDLRAELMAPEAFTRVKALYALECEVVKDAPKNLAKALSDFAARGIPYYAPQDPHYCEWVAQAVGYWEQYWAQVHGQGNKASASAPKLRERAARASRGTRDAHP